MERSNVYVPHVLAALILANGVAVCAAKAEGIESQFRSQTQAIEKDVTAMETLWRRLLPGLGKGDGGARVMRVTCENAVAGTPLVIRVFGVGNSWLFGSARTPKWVGGLQFVHPIRPQELKLAADKGGTALTGKLAATLRFRDELTADPGEPSVDADCTLVLHPGKKPGAALAGTYVLTVDPQPAAEGDKSGMTKAAKGSSPVKGSTGEFSGTVASHESPGGLPWTRVAVNPMAKSIYELHETALGLEAEAVALYQRIRAIDLTEAGGLSYGASLAETDFWRPKRDPFLTQKVRTEKRRDKKGVSLNDLDDMEDLDMDPAPERKKAVAANDPKAKEALKRIKSIRRNVGEMRSLVEAYEKAGEKRPAFVVDTDTVRDRDFGPWYGTEALPYDKDKAQHILPADAGKEGAPRWPRLDVWRLMGPFPPGRWELNTPILPEIVLDSTAEYRIDLTRLQRGRRLRGGDVRKWEECKAAGLFGYAAPPNWYNGNPTYEGYSRSLTGAYSAGLPFSSAYLCADIVSPKDIDLWTAAGVAQRGKVWLNDRLVWSGPREVNERASYFKALFKLPFRKGLNRLVLRLDVGFMCASFWMRICTRGHPKDPKDVEAHEKAVAEARKKIKRLLMRGFRGDLTANFPEAEPPLAWDYKKKMNVLWRTPLRYWSNASPALADDRLFVAIEPHWLVCLSKADGKVLWKRPVTVLDLLPEAERKKGWELFNAWWAARKERDAIPVHQMGPDKWIRSLAYWAEGTGIWGGKAKDDREGASAELLALLDKRDELQQAEDPNEVQDELNQVLEQIAKLKAEASKGDPNSPQAKVRRLDATWGAFMKFMRQHSFVTRQSGYWYDYDGYAFATPVTDGTNVWWKNGMEAVACFDMDGNRKWLKRLESGGAGCPTIPSPILVDGKLILKTPNREKVYRDASRTRFDWKGDGFLYRALDPGTGETVWETRRVQIPDTWGSATPAVLTLTNGRETMRVLATAGGSVLRLDDGKVLLADVGASSGGAPPIPFGDIVVYARPHMFAVRLIMYDRDTIGAKHLWAHQFGSHGVGYHGCHVSDDGLLYHETSFGHYYYRWPCETERAKAELRVSCIVKDVVTGEEVAGVQMHRKGGWYWALGALTKNHMFYPGGDSIFVHCTIPPSHITVMTRGRDPLVLARSVIERTLGGPAFDKDRMYLRGYRGVTCVGYTGDEGRAYEARVVAKTLMDEMQADPPTAAPAPLEPAPIKRSGQPRVGWNAFVASRVEHNRAPHSWVFAGPFTSEQAKAFFKSWGGPGHTPPIGGTPSPKGGDPHFFALNNEVLNAPNLHGGEIEWRDFTLLNEQRRIIALDKAMRGKASAVAYLCAQMHSDRDQVARFEQKLPGVRTWIGKLPVKDGDRVKFGKEVYSLVAEVTVKTMPEDGVPFSPRFFDSTDPKQELARWRQFAGRIRPYLERAVRLAPESAEAARARIILSTWGSSME